MKQKIGLDTSSIISYFKGKHNSIIESGLNNNLELHISSIVIFEILNGVISEKHKEDANSFFSNCVVDCFSENTAKIASSLYKKLKQKGELIGIRDLLIASSYLENNVPVLTENKSEFLRTGLKII